MSGGLYRALAALCFIVGGLTVIGIPILWPAGYLLWKRANQLAEERQRELDALERMAAAADDDGDDRAE